MINILKNGPTDRDNPNYGYHDSEMIITFSALVTPQAQEAVMHAMTDAVSPVNMWRRTSKLDENKWRINYGYASGD